METPTIKKIKDCIPYIEENLITFRKYFKEQNTDLEAALYGDETEYSVDGIVAGVKNIISDMRFLTKSHNLFIKLSTLSERNQIVTTLENLRNNLSSNRVGNVTKNIDNLKTLLRTYNLRTDRQRYLDFNIAIDELNRKAIALSDEIDRVKNNLDKSDTTYANIVEKKDDFEKVLTDLIEQKKSFLEEFNTFKEETSDFRNLASTAQANSKAISTNLTATTDAKKIFDEFIDKINERETQLDSQEKKTDEYVQKLQEFAKSYNEKLNEVINLIEKSKQALQFTTAEGMSAAFASHYQNANKWYYKAGWLAGALFLFCSL